MTIENDITLEGAPNFRDMGGYLGADGRRIKRGMIYRSGDSSQLTDLDIEATRQLKPRLIVDLRSANEASRNEIRWPREHAEFYAADILADLRAENKSLVDMLAEDSSPRGAAAMMESTYAVLPNVLGPVIRHIAVRLSEGKAPVIFHCTVGRDRAGITAAMILFALGVPRDTVIADYLRTSVHIDAGYIRQITRDYLLAHGTDLAEETLDILTFTRIEHFHAAMRTISIEYGSVDTYLERIGIDAPLREKLRAAVLE